MNRRSFLKVCGTVVAASFVPLRLAKAAAAWVKSLAAPILTVTSPNTLDFTGDDIERTHDALWNVDAYIAKKGGIPPVSETTDVVIVGGGLSGLSAGYLLKDKNPILLEQDKRFGGNAKGERFADATFPLGAVYMGDPEPDSDMHKLLTELGVYAKGRNEISEETTVFFQNKFFKSFWNGTSDPEAKAQFLKIHNDFKAIRAASRDNDFFSFQAGGMSKETIKLDAISFEEWLKQRYGQVHPRIMEYFQLYCFSSFIGAIDEISAVQALSFLTFETGTIRTYPGGLGAVSEGLYQKTVSAIGQERVRSGALVLNIKTTPTGVEVCYDDATGKLRTLKAKYCIFAAAKFISKKVIPNIPEDQSAAMDELMYRAYVVGNLIMDRPIPSPSFELYCLRGEFPETPRPGHPETRRGFTDICFATWANNEQSSNGVITVYSGLPYTGARQFLFNPDSHDKYKNQILAEIGPLLATLGMTHENIKGVRMTRWGHAMPLAYKGMLAGGSLEKAQAPIEGRIFFANQDNWANPCFESSFQEAQLAAAKVRALL